MPSTFLFWYSDTKTGRFCGVWGVMISAANWRHTPQQYHCWGRWCAKVILVLVCTHILLPNVFNVYLQMFESECPHIMALYIVLTNRYCLYLQSLFVDLNDGFTVLVSNEQNIVVSHWDKTGSPKDILVLAIIVQ